MVVAHQSYLNGRNFREISVEQIWRRQIQKLNFKNTTFGIGSFIVNLEGKSKLSYYLVHMKESLLENCPNTGKYGPEKSPYLDNFPAVHVYKITWQNHDFIMLSQTLLHSFMTIAATHKKNQEKLNFPVWIFGIEPISTIFAEFHLTLSSASQKLPEYLSAKNFCSGEMLPSRFEI